MFNRLLASSSFFGLFLATKAFAGVYVTNPVAQTVLQSGQTLKIDWVDDGVYPLLGNMGASSIALFTGSAFQQSWLANIAEEIDVSKVGTVNWAVDPNVGPSGTYYFIRFTSKNLKDANEEAYPATAFSAKFTLENMSGSFNGTVLSQINSTSIPEGGNITSTGSTTSTGLGAASTILAGASGHGVNATSGGSSKASGSVAATSTSATSLRPTSSGSLTRPSPASSTSSPNSAQAASQSSGPTNSASAAFGRELSHAGIGAVVLGCMGLGLALCL